MAGDVEGVDGTVAEFFHDLGVAGVVVGVLEVVDGVIGLLVIWDLAMRRASALYSRSMVDLSGRVRRMSLLRKS